MKGTTTNTKFINASPEVIYNAFTDPDSIAVWMAPEDMTGKVHHFDLKVGGGYEMSLFYPESETGSKGKTDDKEDRYTSRFVELSPYKKIVQAIIFDSEDPVFGGEMIMEVLLTAEKNGTTVTIIFKDIPSGIKLSDNEEGTRSTLEKLARYIE
jgi:uncharacterized protein YndB with AHSA1/START domain